jgi:predicted Zn-dependent protease
MTPIRKHNLANDKSQAGALERRVMLAASNISFKFSSSVSKATKEAADRAIKFWGKILNTNKQVSIFLDMKPNLEFGNFGFYQKGNFSGQKSRIVISSKIFKDLKGKKKSKLNQTMIHEVGHALGLGHKGAQGTIMAGTGFGPKSVSESQLATLKKNGFIK